jgi:hypothetical protein
MVKFPFVKSMTVSSLLKMNGEINTAQKNVKTSTVLTLSSMTHIVIALDLKLVLNSEMKLKSSLMNITPMVIYSLTMLMMMKKTGDGSLI